MKDRYDFSQAVVGKYLGKIPRNFQIVAETDEGHIAKWHNPSVRLMAGDRDPMEAIVEKARSIVLAAMDSKTFTFPVDPFKLAEMLSVKVVPKADVRDARTVPGPGDKPQIEYNPTRPPARVRFSICHELGHALFPDCLQQIRHRLFHTETSPVEPDPTTARIRLSEITVKEIAGVPPKLTELAPVSWEPLMDTVVPVDPLAGEKLVIFTTRGGGGGGAGWI